MSNSCTDCKNKNICKYSNEFTEYVATIKEVPNNTGCFGIVQLDVKCVYFKESQKVLASL